MPDVRIVASNFGFPEGPVVMPDGAVILTEIAGRCCTRIGPDGARSTVGNAGGGPNGLAVGPDGALYLCNNGGGKYPPGHWMATGPADDYDGGCIQRIDPKTGDTRVLYTHCNGHKLSAPNDLVFDTQGGFYFTDLGKRYARTRDHGGLYYALPDGSKIVEVAYPILSPNGCGLSPDGKVLYVADTEPARLWAFDIASPGVVDQARLAVAAWRPHRRRSRRLPALRQPGGRGERQHRRRHAARRLHHRHRAGRQGRASGHHAGRVPHQHLLRRSRPAHRLCHAIGDRPPRRTRLGRAGIAPELLTAQGTGARIAR